VRDTLRRETGEQVMFSVEREGTRQSHGCASPTDTGAWRDKLMPRLRMTLPGGTHRELSLRQSGPGQYELAVPVAVAATVSIRSSW
jgi:hypothetical protein